MTITESTGARPGTPAGAVVWLTGRPAAGKSTLAGAAADALRAAGCQVRVLDGDILRRGLTADLGFSPADRLENMRRVAEVAALFAEIGVVCLVALVSPYRGGRAEARRRIGPAFREVYVDAPADVCEERDPKGMYALARRGAIAEFTGVSSDYEPPLEADLVIDTAAHDTGRCVAQLVGYIRAEFPELRCAG